MSPELARNGHAQPLAASDLGMKVEAEPKGTPSWKLSMNYTSCGRFFVKGAAEQGSSMAAMDPSKPLFSVKFPSQATLSSTV